MTQGVVFNGKFLSGPARGLARVASETIPAVDARLDDDPARAQARSWEIACRPDTSRTLPLRQVATTGGGRIRGALWEQLDLPGLAAGRLLVNLCNMSPIAAPDAGPRRAGAAGR